MDNNNRIGRSSPPAASLVRDPAMGRLVEPTALSPIGLDLFSNAEGAREAYANRGPQMDLGRLVYQVMSMFLPRHGQNTAYNPGPAPTFPPSYDRTAR